MKLSIIIPVYGVELYIEKCLISVFEQDIPETDYEVIVINDGTEDNSWSIVKRVTEGHNNARLIEQENQGLSAARNHGLEIAQGEYIWFVDSDDWIDSFCLSKILLAARGNDVLALATMYEEGDWNGFKKYFVRPDTFDKIDFMSQDYPTPAQFYICRKAFLDENNFRFVKGIKHEDCLFTPIIVATATRFMVYNQPVYHFLKRANSITTVNDSKRGADYCFIIGNLYKFRSQIKEQDVLYCFDGVIARIIKAHLSLAYKLDKASQASIESFYKNNREVLNSLLKSKLNSRLIFYLFKYTPLSLVWIYEIMEKIWYQLNNIMVKKDGKQAAQG